MYISSFLVTYNLIERKDILFNKITNEVVIVTKVNGEQFDEKKPFSIEYTTMAYNFKRKIMPGILIRQGLVVQLHYGTEKQKLTVDYFLGVPLYQRERTLRDMVSKADNSGFITL